MNLDRQINRLGDPAAFPRMDGGMGAMTWAPRPIAGVFDVADYGAIGDGVVLDTLAIQSAIDACAAAGGGTVRLPAGKYLTGALWLRDYVTVDLVAGATLVGSDCVAHFPAYTSDWEGPNAYPMHAGVINGQGLRDVALTGRGTIDGGGAIWWELYHQKRLTSERPRLVRLLNCNNVLIDGLTFINSPMWTINPVACDNVTVTRITIRNPEDSPNTDGINPESCSNVRISDCHIDVGDDCIAIKAGTEVDGRRLRRACENITVTNCTMLRGHGGVVIGSEITGGVRNVVISNCVFSGTDRGIRIKARRGRGYAVEDVRADNLLMDNVLCPIVVNMFYGPGVQDASLVTDTTQRPVTDSTPAFRRLRYSNITARRVRSAAVYMLGLPERAVEDVTIDHLSVFLDPQNKLSEPPAMSPITPPMCGAGMYFQHIRGLRLSGVDVHDAVGPTLSLDDVHNARFSEIAADGLVKTTVKRCSNLKTDGSIDF